MTPQLILTLNAAATGACAIGMLAARSILPAVFGLDSPLLLDTICDRVSRLRRRPRDCRQASARGTKRRCWRSRIADALWVVFSAIVLMLFWSQFTVVGRVLVFAVACAVEVFATLQYRAAGAGSTGQPRLA